MNLGMLQPLAFVLLLSFWQVEVAFAKTDDRPNVIVIMSDDQGNGDYGFIGNEIIRTPSLDKLHSNSGYLDHFYVSPVCAPTRACLMTGRYNYRTRCIDTYIGRAMMDPAEITLAEFLEKAGYRTGIFGKWHLGDNYPMRPMDQGFQESLVHRGGGIGQPSDPIGAEGKYTNPTLIHNGVEKKMTGYCTDLYFDAALDSIESSVREGKKFFTYIATNAPHGPFHDVPPELYEEYRNVDFSPILVNQLKPNRKPNEFDKLARIAAMITNIDENVGRLMKKLKALGIRENTIVIYLNDNGPNSWRYVGKMRGMKTGVDDGGIRSPLLVHWPARIRPGTTNSALCAHIDVLPTLLEACNVKIPEGHKVDGRSFLPLLTEQNAAWPTRQVVLQAHRGNQPQRYHHFSLHEDPWKLVHPSGFGKETFSGDPKFQLYDLRKDPMQKHDLAKQRPQVVQRLRKAYDDWFDDVSSTRSDNYAPPRIVIGTRHQLRTVLTRQDWRHATGRPWGGGSNGFWLLENPNPASFEIEVILRSAVKAGKATIRYNDMSLEMDLEKDQVRHRSRIKLPAGKIRLQVEVSTNGKTVGPHQVILEVE